LFQRAADSFPVLLEHRSSIEGSGSDDPFLNDRLGKDKTMPEPLKYSSYGGSNARTILFLHGGGVAGWMWNSVVARLPDFHCLVPDLPEHGLSMEIRPFTMELAADLAVQLVREQAHGGKAVVVGLSEGAQVAVQMLATAPEVFEAAMVSSALLLPLPAVYQWLYSPRLLAWTFQLSIPPFRNSEWWMRLNMKYAAAIPDDFYPQYRQNFQTMTEGQFVNLMLANQRFRMPGHLEQVSVPTLVVSGRKEYAAVQKSARQLAAVLTHARSASVDLGKGASLAKEHNWAMNAPDLFARTLRDFINGMDISDVIRPR
jgi:pimeloyl-ACP methyl ester carboxylesterase